MGANVKTIGTVHLLPPCILVFGTAVQTKCVLAVVDVFATLTYPFGLSIGAAAVKRPLASCAEGVFHGVFRSAIRAIFL